MNAPLYHVTLPSSNVGTQQAPHDLFPELLPATYMANEDASALAWGLMQDW